MRKLLLSAAALAAIAGASAAITAAPANAEVRFNLNFGTPYYYAPYPPYYYGPPSYYYRPNCYWDAYYGRVCY